MTKVFPRRANAVEQFASTVSATVHDTYKMPKIKFINSGPWI